MEGLTWGFWWLNVVTSAYCVLYWARKRYPDGTHALVMPAGQIWVWQLIFSFVVLSTGISPWNLLWLGIVSIVLSIVIARAHHNLKMQQRIKRESVLPAHAVSWMQRTAETFLESEVNKNAFRSFMKDFPTLSKEFDLMWGRTFSPTNPLSKWRLALMLNEVSETLASRNDFLAANTCIHCSSLFYKGNPLTWAASAVVAFAWEDRIASKWASKVMKYRISEQTPSDLREQLSTEDGKALLKEARKRMKAIVALCELNDEWRDTSILVGQTGVSDRYFDL